MANKFSKQILQLLAVDEGDVRCAPIGEIIGYSGLFFHDNMHTLCQDVDSLQEQLDFKIMVVCLMAALSDDDLIELGFVAE